MHNEINQHPLIRSYRSAVFVWQQQTREQWQLGAEEFTSLRARHGDLPALVAAQAFCVGQAARKEEFYEQAAQYFNEAEKVLPDWPLVPEALAAVSRRLGRRAEAEALLNRALKMEGNLLHARIDYAEMLCERNNYKAAEDVLKLGLKFHPEEVGFHCLLGDIALSDRRLESAERHYQHALTLASECAAAYIGLSSIRTIEQRYNEALDQIKKALEFNQRSAPAYINRGIIRYAFNQRAEAEQDFEHAIRIAPRDSQNYFRLALFFWQKNEDMVTAERYFRLAINCESYRSECHSSLALLYLQMDRLEEAERLYRQAVILNPEDILALQGLGVLGLIGNDRQSAEEHLGRATSLIYSSRRYLIAKLAAKLDPKLKVVQLAD